MRSRSSGLHDCKTWGWKRARLVSLSDVFWGHSREGFEEQPALASVDNEAFVVDTELRPSRKCTALCNRAPRSRRAVGTGSCWDQEFRPQNMRLLLEEERFGTVSLDPHCSASKLRPAPGKTCSVHQDNVRQAMFAHDSTNSMC